jgi:hypothetical protein
MFHVALYHALQMQVCIKAVRTHAELCKREGELRSLGTGREQLLKYDSLGASSRAETMVSGWATLSATRSIRRTRTAPPY